MPFQKTKSKFRVIVPMSFSAVQTLLSLAEKTSKFCAEHSNEVRDDGFIPSRLEQFSNLPEIVRNGQVEENNDESVLVGCKKQTNIDRFYDRTAGVLAAVRPCGIAAAFCEMFTCESPSQVFFFIFNSFGRAAENFSRLKVLGYDRTCGFHPFLERLAKKGNLGAQLLLSKVKFLVDKFHCEKHTEATWFPPDNPRCKYHPDLERFSEIRGTNTECAEQFFKWLGSFKYMCKKM